MADRTGVSSDRFLGIYDEEEAPPWDIGRPQGEFVRLEEAGEIQGSVLDVGCGTGENALYLAGKGHEAWGVDLVPTAIQKAQAKAKERGIQAHFLVGNALQLDLGRTFDSAIDSGVFHVFSDEDRPRYVASLARVLHPGGTYFMACFSEREPPGWGPRRVTEAEIRASFADGWRVNYIREATFDTNLADHPHIQAWLSSITVGDFIHKAMALHKQTK